MGTASIEDVAAAAPNGRNWFQLYLWTDRDRSLELIERAAKAGNDTLMVTVDTAVAGARSGTDELHTTRDGCDYAAGPGAPRGHDTTERALPKRALAHGSDEGLRRASAPRAATA